MEAYIVIHRPHINEPLTLYSQAMVGLGTPSASQNITTDWERFTRLSDGKLNNVGRTATNIESVGAMSYMRHQSLVYTSSTVLTLFALIFSVKRFVTPLLNNNPVNLIDTFILGLSTLANTIYKAQYVKNTTQKTFFFFK